VPAKGLLAPRQEAERLAHEAVAITLVRQKAQATGKVWQPLTHQIPPEGKDWFLYLLLGGRGSGKTDGAAHYVDEQARRERIRIAIIAPTLGDAVEACVNGPSGLKAHNPRVELRGGAGGMHVRWPNGSEAKLFGAHSPEDVERLRAGGNRSLVWAEELAAWRYLDECWQHMRYGLRLGEHPRVVASTTPKPRKLLKQLINDPRTVVRRATTDDNPHLNAGVRSALYEDYGGTRLGRQELGGELLEDVEGALWQASWIEANRVTEHPALTRIVVAIDPAATAEATSDFTGLCVAGLGEDGEYYVLRSAGVRLSPSGWANKAIDWYDEYAADKIICEINQGGDMVSSTLHSVRRDLPVKVIHASRGKTIRAEPVATLDEQGRIHHVGQFPTLEDQMFSFPISNENDDEVDARVYSIIELMEGRKRRGGVW
jgi:predicted phage terminase large subunit-like protein